MHTGRVVSGECRYGKRPPPHTFPFEEDDVENNRRRIPMTHHFHPRSPMCMWLRTPPTRTGHPRCYHDPPRPPQGIHVRPKPLRSGPGIGQSHARLRMPPPPPRTPCTLQNLVAGRVGCGVTVVPWVAAGEPGPRTCQSLGGRLSGATCAMPVDGQGNGGSILPANP